MIKHFIQFKGTCKACKREVDVVSTSEGEGLFLSLHFKPGTLSFCKDSKESYVR